MFQLRDDQSRLSHLTVEHMLEGGAPCLVSPTGSGKTVMLAEIARRFREWGYQVILAAHRNVIIEQIAESCSRHIGEPIGFYSRKCMTEDRGIVVTMIPTLARRMQAVRAYKGRVLLLDECHHISAPTYQKIIKEMSPSFFAGATATPVTPTGAGLGKFGITKLILGPSPRRLMDEGSLCEYDMFAGDACIDTKGVPIVGGDYNKKVIEQRVIEVEGDFVRDLKAFNPQLQPTITVTVSIAHAHALAEEYRQAGITAEVVYDKTPEKDRDSAFERFRKRQLDVLVSVALVDEGLDLPEAVCLQLVRPTRSLRLWKQLIGRVLRTDRSNPFKRAIIIVHSDCWKFLPTPDLPIDWTLEGKVALPSMNMTVKNNKIVVNTEKPARITVAQGNSRTLKKIDTRSIYEKEIDKRVRAAKKNLYLVEELNFCPSILRPWANNPEGLSVGQRRRIERALGLPAGYCDPKPVISY
jgi:superfamily II DNA or RNA helicase